MKDILSKVFIFTAGAAIGVVTTRKYFKTKYEKITQEEIESVKRTFLGDDMDVPSENVMEGDAPDMYYEKEADISKEEYERLINEHGYGYSVNEEEEEEDVSEPKLISLEDFEDGENPTSTLYYWADGVVTNDRNKELANVDELIGLKNLNAFKDHRVDSIYVRNYEDEIDYEILRDSRKFSEIS